MAAAVRALGLDVGEQRVGVALCDPSGLVAAPLTTLRRTTTTIDELVALAAAEQADCFVLGLPLMMRNGREGPQAAAVRAFADELAAKTRLPIEFYDERLTSVMAERMEEQPRGRAGRRPAERERQRAAIDARAAAIILQSWLDHRRMAAERAARSARRGV